MSLTDQQKFNYFIAYPTVFFASPIIMLVSSIKMCSLIREKNIKERIPGRDPIQNQYLEK